MTYKIYTFGCKVNAYESQALKERLEKEGHTPAKGEEADIYFVNTCAVTNEAERKDLQRVRRISRSFPGKPIYIMGCSSQIHKEYYLAIPGVKGVVGSSEKNIIETFFDNKDETIDHVNMDSRHFTYQDTPTHEGEKNVRGYIKVQDGCDNFCSYCVVPFTRGKSRCRNHQSIIEECKSLLNRGIKELIIGGIDTGCYIDPEDDNYHFVNLLHDLLDLSNEPYRIRVSSIEASQVSDEYISLFASHPDKLCPHFHLPLQSGSEHVLQRMNRKYHLEDFRNMCKRIKEQIPDVAFSSDVITGFPAESEEEFQETYDFCKEIGFMRIHAFPYSERPFTMAAKLRDPIPMRIRMDRTKRLIELSEENDQKYREQLKGKEVTVLVEGLNKKTGEYEGYSENYLRFSFKSETDITGQFIKLKL
ncbi:MAG: tRNA (N(6)-L-threonylcarbamoyladenosine(37)-C(2))-methylthiotransferase MtaB [Bacilli bacterium]|nr:tRNA (N(6)-L-threonylcarbamoyladenosine(37)-C(2))-methylthiotransferase MtaB [Bacilli bacterium]